MTPKPTNKINRKTHLDARVGLYHRLAWSFVILTTALVVLILMLSLQRATITIIREPQAATTDFSIPIYSDKPPQNDGTFLVGRFYNQEVTAEVTVRPVAGTTIDDYAHGIVTIVNETNRAQPLVATTRFVTANELLFRLVRGVIVPAQGKISAEIKADETGSAREITASAHLRIPGLNPTLQEKIYATSDAAFTGGTRELSSITESDIERARQTLTEKLEAIARGTFAKELETAQTPISGQARSMQMISFAHDFKPGKSADSLQASAKAQATLFAFDEAALIEQARTHLQDSLPSNYVLQTLQRESFSYVLESPPGKSDTLKVHLEGTALINPQDPAFKPDLWTNMPIAEVKKQLENLPSVSSAVVQAPSFWSDRTPRDPRAITIRFLP